MPSIKIQRLHLSWHKSFWECCCFPPGSLLFLLSPRMQFPSAVPEEGCCKEWVETAWNMKLSTLCIKLLKMEKIRSQRIGLVQQKEGFPWETASAMSPLLPSRPKHKHELKEVQKVISGADRTPLCPATSLLNLLLCTDHLSWEPSQISGFTTGLKNKAKAAAVPVDLSYQKAGGSICSQWKELQKATPAKGPNHPQELSLALRWLQRLSIPTTYFS